MCQQNNHRGFQHPRSGVPQLNMLTDKRCWKMYNQPPKKATAISIRRWTVLCRLSVLQSACTSMVMLVRLMPYTLWTLWTLWTPLKVVRPLWQCQVCIIWVTSSHMGFIRGYEFDMSHMVSHISFIPSTWRWAIVGQVNTFRPQCISTRDKDRKPTSTLVTGSLFLDFFAMLCMIFARKSILSACYCCCAEARARCPQQANPWPPLALGLPWFSHLISPYCHMIGQGPIGPKALCQSPCHVLALISLIWCHLWTGPLHEVIQAGKKTLVLTCQRDQRQNRWQGA